MSLTRAQGAELTELAHQALDAVRAQDRAAVELATTVYPLDLADAKAKLHHTRSQADAAERALVDAIVSLVRQDTT